MISKLRLEKGDIIVVKDIETLRYLSEVRVPGIDATIPMVYAPQGIQKLCRQDLLNLLEQLDSSDKSVLPEYAISQPSSAPL